MPKNKKTPKKEILALIHASTPEINSFVTTRDVFTLIDELKKIKSPPSQTAITLLLNSPGGDIYAAYKLVTLLRARCTTFDVVVPFAAKSAATLMCLGADKIWMGQQSELGPLDAPIEHPLVEGIQLSALDGVKPLVLLADFCEELAINRLGATIRQIVGLGRQESINAALRFTAEFVRPIIKQLQPSLVNMCFRTLQVAEKLGRELLVRYMFKGKSHAEEMADSVIDELVWEYPEHAYAIGIEEARRLQLQVDEVEKLSNWDKLWTYWRKRDELGGTHIHLITAELGKGEDISTSSKDEIGQSGKK